jgi:hypothetical protein
MNGMPHGFFSLVFANLTGKKSAVLQPQLNEDIHDRRLYSAPIGRSRLSSNEEIGNLN